MTDPVVTRTDLPLRKIVDGKVRDVYELDADRVLLVATDRLSAFDVVFDQGIPGKGRALTRLSAHWFGLLGESEPHHFITTDDDAVLSAARKAGVDLSPYAAQLAGRTTLSRRVSIVPIECVARGYIAGSGWKEYQADRTVCGIPLPDGLRHCDRLPEPLFTPATKAERGDHDENISFAHTAGLVGPDLAAELRSRTLALYRRIAGHAAARGIIIADTKLEFGRHADGRLLLADEIFTPDSSRFWPADRYEPGRAQESYDKQPVRDWAEQSGWNKAAPAPTLPGPIIDQIAERYSSVVDLLTGPPLQASQAD